jgi:choline-sulfatase
MVSKYDRVVMISIDTLRADGIASNPVKLFPDKIGEGVHHNKIDDFLAESFLFNNAISAAPYTATSHAAYFTGQWPRNNGVCDQISTKLRSRTIFKMAQQKGYHTTFKTDFPFILGKHLNFLGGVDEYFIEDDDAALDAMKQHSKSFSLFHFGQVHYPYGFHILKYGGNDYLEKVSALEKHYRLSPEFAGLKDLASETHRSEMDLELLYRYKNIISHLYGSKMDHDLLQLYVDGINYFNETKLNSFLEKLMNSLKGDNYLIVLFSDHGENWSDGSYGHFNSLEEPCIRVPIAFLAKDIKPGIYQNRIRTIDVCPTLDELIFQEEYKCDGASLADMIYGGKIEKHREAFSAVWVTALDDYQRNVAAAVADLPIDSGATKPIRYSACSYLGDHKFVEHYKFYHNRHLEMADLQFVEMFDVSDLVSPKKIQVRDNVEEFRASIAHLNVEEPNGSLQSETMRKYFQMQGYSV